MDSPCALSLWRSLRLFLGTQFLGAQATLPANFGQSARWLKRSINFNQVTGNPNLWIEYAHSVQVGGEFTYPNRRTRLGMRIRMAQERGESAKGGVESLSRLAPSA